jgi:putative ABC transport system permease protein
VAVLGEGAAASLFGAEDPIGRHVKVNEQWFQVIGVAGPQLTVQADVAGLPAQDRNNLIYVPLYAAIFRLEDGQSRQRDEIDGVYLQMRSSNEVPASAALLRGLLNVSHREAGDFTIVSPAELLAEQRRTQRIFEMVMVAIASISLLVGGIGIMNIMLASVMERTREIGVRRAIGARRRDVVRQFLIETTIISLAGGVVGIIVGVALSQLIGYLAGWSTIVTTASIVLAFLVSVGIGIVFGLYPAVRAASLDPVKALHYE